MRARLITNRFEWQRLATQLASSPYHHPGWTWAAVRRIVKQTSKPVGCAYLRVWHDDTLVGCPVITLGSETFNTPRAWPQTLAGPKLSDRALGHVVTQAVDGLVLFNDEAQLVAIRSVVRRLDRLSVNVRVFGSITDGDLNALAAAAPWTDEQRRNQWVNGLAELGRTSWDLRFRRHLDDHHDVLGWSALVALPGRPETEMCVAALRVGTEPPSWTSLR